MRLKDTSSERMEGPLLVGTGTIVYGCGIILKNDQNQIYKAIGLIYEEIGKLLLKRGVSSIFS
jgi:hypothetical protein